jgi:hypothetical protein
MFYRDKADCYAVDSYAIGKQAMVANSINL